jgi:nucleoside-diphosphate-sugar epimerase
MAEGAVRAMSQTLGLPAVICRMDIQYGTFSDGGMPVRQLRQILHGEPIRLPRSYPLTAALIHESDLVGFVEPCLEHAAVPPLVVNWCGDEAVPFEEYLDYMGELVGRKPIYVYDDEGHSLRRERGRPDPARRQAITGPCKTTWRAGLAQIVEHWEPLLREAGPPR